MTLVKGRFSQFDEDAYRLPEGMRRVAYDADTQRYTFRDRSGQLYQSAPGEEYGALKPVARPLSHRRNVTITEIPDPALRQWSAKPAKTFNDILPSAYMTAAQSGTEPVSPMDVFRLSGETFVQAAKPKVQGIVGTVRRCVTLRRPGRDVTRSDSIRSEKRRLLEDEPWEVVRKEDGLDSRISRSKSEMRPSRYHVRQ